MALVNLLKIGADGLGAEHDPSSDSINMQDVQLGGTSLTGTSGVDVIGDLASAYTNFTPAGNTLQDTLNAIDTTIGLITPNEALVYDQYTNGEASPITLGQVVYISDNDEVMLADGNVAAKDNPIGIVAQASIAAAASGDIATHGLVPGAIAGATAGDKYFLSNTPGVLSVTPPTGTGAMVTLMGYAKNATDLLVMVTPVGKRF